MESTSEDHDPAPVNGAAGEAACPSSPAPEPRPAEPFVPVRRSMWRHFTYGLRHYADFSGRATRAEYWSFQALEQGIGFLLVLMAAGLLMVLSFSVLKEAVGTGEVARYVEVAASEGMPGLKRELIESAPVTEEGTGGCILDDAVEGGFVLPGPEAPAPWMTPKNEPSGNAQAVEPGKEVWEACLAWAQCVKDGYARLDEESVYPTAMLASIGLLVVLFNLWILGTLIPSLAVTWRRLHDINLSGAWFFLGFIPYIGNLIVLTMTLIDSKRGANRYGPPTKYP